MSATAIAACNFEPAEQTVATGHQAPNRRATQIKFREDLWHEYRREAINAGLSAALAAEYASALSPELGLAASVSEMAPISRSWFYQSRVGVVTGTLASGLIDFAHFGRGKGTGPTGAPRASRFAFGFRPWNTGKKS